MTTCTGTSQLAASPLTLRSGFKPGLSVNDSSKPSGGLMPVPTAKDPVETTRTSAAEEWSPVERRAAFFQQEFGYRPFGRVQQVGFTSR